MSVPGASAYFLGGGVIYTRKAMVALLELTPAKLEGLRSATEPMASLLAETVRSSLDADWGLAETGRPVPAANRYGDAQGHACLAISGRRKASRILETGSHGRVRERGAGIARGNSAWSMSESRPQGNAEDRDPRSLRPVTQAEMFLAPLGSTRRPKPFNSLSDRAPGSGRRGVYRTLRQAVEQVYEGLWRQESIFRRAARCSRAGPATNGFWNTSRNRPGKSSP
ncbi:MAG: CinA family protein [Roseiarcus sp.]